MCFSNRHTQPSFFPSQDTREVVTWAEGLQLGAAARERLVTGKISEPEDLVALLQLDNSLWYLGILLHLLSRQALLLFGHMGKVFPVSLELFFRLGGSCQIPGKSTCSSSALQRCHKLNRFQVTGFHLWRFLDPEIFLWAHKVKDGEGKESPHYVPLLLAQSAMPAQGGGGQTSLRRFILPVRFGQDLHKKGIKLGDQIAREIKVGKREDTVRMHV